MKKSIILTFTASLLLMMACLKNKELVEDTPTSIFEYVWNDFDQHYGGFEQRNVDWDAVYTQFAPRVNDNISDIELWNVLTEMMDLLDDQHVAITDTKTGKGFASGKLNDELLAEREFDLELIKTSYLAEDYQTLDSDGEDFVYGTIEGENIGYIHFPNFEEDVWQLEFDNVIAELSTTDGLIVDDRNNGGGIPLSARFASGRFAQTKELAFNVQSKNGPGPNDFDEKSPYYMEPQGAQQYTKPIVALCNHSTVSAGEEFLLYLKTQEHIQIVGDSTSNALATPTFKRMLPNAWHYQLPTQLYTVADGSSPEGIGIVPDVYLRNDTLNVQAGLDEVLEFGVELLK